MTAKLTGQRMGKRQSFLFLLASMLLATMFGNMAFASSFDSGSDGSDGALVLTEPGWFIFDPKNFTRPDGKQLDPDGDGVYHFTTISVSEGVIVGLKANPLGTKPLVWLASGDVQINGTLYLGGDEGHLGTVEIPREAGGGVGGYTGGMGGRLEIGPTPGEGPGGGKINAMGGRSGAGGSHLKDGTYNTAGTHYGNPYLKPHLGGSGGGGGAKYNDTYAGGGGGGGGGAIILASSGAITVNGAISARGGFGGYAAHSYAGHGGGGSGGAIRLMANTLLGANTAELNVMGGGLRYLDGRLDGNSGLRGSSGRIRIETYTNNFDGDYVGAEFGDNLRFSSPGKVFLTDATLPELYVVRINGIAVPPTAVGSFNPPDLEINASEPVTLELEAKYVPVGTVVNLSLRTEDEGVTNFQSTPLDGTFEQSTATASALVPHGYSRFMLHAKY